MFFKLFCYGIYIQTAPYGHATMKPTQLLGSHPWIVRLARTMPADFELLVDSTDGVRHLPCSSSPGRRRVSGAAGLEDGQVYPWEYGCVSFIC